MMTRMVPLEVALLGALLVSCLSLCSGAAVKELSQRSTEGATRGQDGTVYYSTSDPYTCPEYTCPNTGQCIYWSWVCDGYCDCQYYCEDESTCGETTMFQPPYTSTAPPACSETFDVISGRCVLVDPFTSTTWKEARYLCEKLGADLLVIDTLDFYGQLIQFITEKGLDAHDYWIGGSDEEEEQHWVWVNGEPMMRGTPLWAIYYYSSTYLQEPQDSVGANKDCAYLDQKRFFYVDDENCDLLKGAICQVSTSLTLPDHHRAAAPQEKVQILETLLQKTDQNRSRSAADVDKPVHGPEVVGHGPVQAGHGLAQAGHGPAQAGHGPAQAGHGPAQAGHGPAQQNETK